MSSKNEMKELSDEDGSISAEGGDSIKKICFRLKTIMSLIGKKLNNLLTQIQNWADGDQDIIVKDLSDYKDKIN